MTGRAFSANLPLLIDLLGTEGFERAIYDCVCSVAPVGALFAIEIFDDRAGHVVMTEGKDIDFTRRARQISRDYALEDHAADDLLQAHRRESPGHFETVLQRGADREEAFRLKYFDSFGAAQEISSFNRQAGSTLYLGMSSNEQGFTAENVEALTSIVPLVLALVRKHSVMVLMRGLRFQPQMAQREEMLRRLLVDFNPDLTPREAEICAGIVAGFRAEAIASRLSISPNTVATHRKRAYAKLGISSQTELFGILFTGWTVN